MLAYTPMHALLFGLPGDEPGPSVLVMTSGNLGGEPICFTDDDALDRLSHLADGWLMHDREILVPCDDSVVRVVTGGGAANSDAGGGAANSDDAVELPIRRSRGYAPLPVALPVPVPPTLAVGGDLKNTLAVAEHKYAWLSQHIGDMDDLATLSAFDSAERHLEALTGVTPEIVVADSHPGYRSTAWAERNAGERPVRSVQHHHAHIASVMAEHGLDGSQRVLGFAFDGTGYGPDGAIWGGEVLLADYKGYQRLAQLKYVPLAGGDISVLRPYRMALSHLWAAGVPWDPDLAPVQACPDDERKALRHQLETGLGCAPTSSMGRLFDAVSSLVGVRHVVAYEAQAAIELEGLSRNADQLGTRLCVRRRRGAASRGDRPRPGARCGHRRPARRYAGRRDRGEVPPCRRRSGGRPRRARGHGGQPVALSGGVFQNALLLRLALDGLRAKGFQVITHRHVPPNDGGIALGQLLVGTAG